MISFKQRGRAGLQFLGSLQQFSSSALRDQAEADYAAQPEAPALAEEWKSGDVRPHDPGERVGVGDRRGDVPEFGGTFNELFGVARPRQEGVVRGHGELGVGEE